MKSTLNKTIVLFLLSGLILSACAGANAAASPQAVAQAPVVDQLNVVAEGRLMPAQSVRLSFKTGGQVVEVLVSEGDLVEAGQVLARLGNQEQLEAAVAQAQLNRAQAQLGFAQAQLSFAQAQLSATQANLNLSQAHLSQSQGQLELLSAQQALETIYESADLAAADAQLAVARADKSLEARERNLRYALNPVGQSSIDAVNDARLAYETTVANQQLLEAGPLAQAVNSARDAANQAFSRYQDAQARYDECNGCNQRERDALLTVYQNAQHQFDTARLELETALTTQADAVNKAQNQLEKAENNLAALQAGPDQIKVALAQAELAMAEETLADARARLETLSAGPDPDEIALTEARIAQAEALIAQSEAQVLYAEAQPAQAEAQLVYAEAQLAHTEAQLAYAEAAIVAAEAALDDIELRATISGTVANLDLKVGEQVAPGQPAVVLADFSSWLVETDNLTEIEVPEITVGQTAKVTFDALPEITLIGRVTFISQLFEAKRGDVTYTVKITLDEIDPRLKWGMTAVATFEKRE